ncbi:MAG TPA: hypothetical protein VG963_03055 [Polyangiaceae bacterium]|nr:hypothetical protein [Polyangiaceae bacterium]
MRTHRTFPDGPGGHDAAGAPRDEAADLAHRLVEREHADNELAHRLRVAMDGDTPACAALKLGVGQRSVARAWRTGHAHAHLLRAICRVYGVDGHWLLTGEGERARTAARAPTGPARSSPSEDLLVEVSTRLASLLAELEHYRSGNQGP